MKKVLLEIQPNIKLSYYLVPLPPPLANKIVAIVSLSRCLNLIEKPNILYPKNCI